MITDTGKGRGRQWMNSSRKVPRSTSFTGSMRQDASSSNEQRLRSDQMTLEHDAGIQDENYVRQRLKPAPGDPDYLHLVDLIAALDPFRTSEPLTILDY